jgi:hypothetical protein
MKSHWVLIALLPGISLSLRALQARTPEAALEEIATTNKPEVIARHLPEPVQKSIDELPKPQKQQVLDTLLSMKAVQLDGCTVRPAINADGWEIINQQGESKGKVKLANAFISGVDALLHLQVDSEDGSQMFIVTMHLDGDDWRIDDFGPWAKTDLGLHKLVYQPTALEKNEAAARETLQTIVNAVRRYAGMFPETGFPSQLSVLTGSEKQEATAEHAALIDELFTAEPLIKDGYQFRYLLTRRGGGQLYVGPFPIRDPGEFQITATPVEFGKTGAKNFFISRNSVVHVTAENRDAADDDPTSNDQE